MSEHHFEIPIPTDDDGFIGRECLKCKKYFKLKPGTGLPTSYCHCPYCEYEGSQDTFFTPDQLQYAESQAEKIAYENFIEPMLDELDKSFKQLERSTRGNFIQIKVSSSRDKPFFPVAYYNEKELETKLTCDGCGLEFAIYGVFSHCPDCKKINAFTIFRKSLEVSLKQFELFDIEKTDTDTIQTNLKFILSNAISAFDGLGKELRNRFNGIFPTKPRNLFQNLDELNTIVKDKLALNLEIETKQYDEIRKLFQVRHIFEHNMGVIDVDFIKKVPSFSNQLGRKYQLQKNEVMFLIESIKSIGALIEKKLADMKK